MRTGSAELMKTYLAQGLRFADHRRQSAPTHSGRPGDRGQLAVAGGTGDGYRRAGDRGRVGALLVAPRRLRRRRSEAFYAGAVSGGAMIGAGSNQTDESSSSSFAWWAQSNGISRPWARFSSRRAADAYQAAIDRLENSSYRNALAEFRRDHLRHITEFGDILSSMGRTPPKEGDMKALLTKGKVVIAGLMACRRIRGTCCRTVWQERRHCEWILEQLKHH
jgi:hypothetical protein